MSVLVETTVGDLVFDLYTKQRPRCCMNFLKLCACKYFNFCSFFNIQQNFAAQCGDPTDTGRGGESIFRRLYGDQACYFEIENTPPLQHEKLGTISMVNNGQDMVGSQFFVTLEENLTYLDEKHCVFGELTEGFDTLSKLNEAICDKNNRPLQDIRIMHTIVLDDPYANPRGFQCPSRSPSPDERLAKTKRIGVDESVDQADAVDLAEVEEKIAAREARAKAHVLEMVGDLHFAEEKPQDNVLFVCRLNPVTTEDDLEIIFARFGKIIRCEIIRDKQTDASLQYAFIEFEKAKSCEDAYLKMDNVLIDDRRIHVDFGQSVSRNHQWREQLEAFNRRRNAPTLARRKTNRDELMRDDRRPKDGYRREKSHDKRRRRSRSTHRHRDHHSKRSRK